MSPGIIISIRSMLAMDVPAIVLVMALSGGAQTTAVGEQVPAVSHNTWTSGAPIPTPVVAAASAVLKAEIYVVGGENSASTIVADTQIYNPITNSWSAGASLPTAVEGASAAVFNNILYVFGGTSDGGTASNAVWAYNPKTKSWSAKSAMPTARYDTAAVVENKIIYLIGGEVNSSDFVATVESYDPATNAWAEEAPMLGTKQSPAAGLLGNLTTGFTIMAADGATQPSQITGNTEGYEAATNTWTERTADATARVAPCFGSVGGKLYVVGGYLNNGLGRPAATVNEAFELSKNKWQTTLAPIPQGVMWSASAVYNGQLYCIGGWATIQGTVLNSLQIYQP
ncbi:MAG TPA: kelch repeat-containing protein [Candidatus Sulfotelmatobacter sp.]|nr:kelch repeat-containing protein [Candidatus Sulfotelmatobacter sp.]